MAKKIMVVDDSKVAQLQLQRILSDSPYEVISCCQNGEDAVEQYRVLKPDLITMDILMPGLDGLEAARKILEEDPDASGNGWSGKQCSSRWTAACTGGSPGWPGPGMPSRRNCCWTISAGRWKRPGRRRRDGADLSPLRQGSPVV